MCVPYRSTHRSSDCDESFKSSCIHACEGVGNLIYIYKNQYLCRLSVCMCVCVCVCLSYRSTHRSSDCDETLKSSCKHARDGVGNLIYI